MMNTLIIEDNFVCRKLISACLSKHGVCDTAISGEEGFSDFFFVHDSETLYDHVPLCRECFDILTYADEYSFNFEETTISGLALYGVLYPTQKLSINFGGPDYDSQWPGHFYKIELDYKF